VYENLSYKGFPADIFRIPERGGKNTINPIIIFGLRPEAMLVP
jgi:hypothetical protein